MEMVGGVGGIAFGYTVYLLPTLTDTRVSIQGSCWILKINLINFIQLFTHLS
jgi:hypothetical protein